MRALIVRPLSILVLLTSTANAAPTEWNEVREAADTLPRLHALLVLHDGEPVIEQVRRGPGLDRPAPLKSLSKTVLSAVQCQASPVARSWAGNGAGRAVPRRRGLSYARSRARPAF